MSMMDTDPAATQARGPSAGAGFPVFLNLAGRRAVVVGGGEAALAKARLLAESGAEVHLFALGSDPALPEAVVVRRRPVAAEDFDGAVLCYVALADAAETAATVALARARGVLVNALDRPGLSDFATPAVIRRGPVRVAIATGGAAPALARSLRAHIERALPDVLGPLVTLCGAWRARVTAAIASPLARRRFWDAVVEGPVAEALRSGDVSGLEPWIERTLAAGEPPPREGRAFLVGAGPGDPGALTLAAVRAVQQADLILHDALVGPQIREFARREARMIDVGKRCGRHAMSQEEINRLLIEHVRAGEWVVRLKGGDPLIFGRGGEEVACLRAEGLKVEVIPGVTAALAVAARLGIPLTERGLARTLHLLTAHSHAGALPEYDWPSLVALDGTIAVYMGARTLSRLAEKLIAAGMDPEMPAVAVENATLPAERRIASPLYAIGPRLAASGVTGPTLTLIGRVVAFAAGPARDKDYDFSPPHDAPMHS